MAQFKVKVKHIKKQIEWMYPLLQKLMDDADWRVGEYIREWVQEVIDEPEVTASHLVIYSPALGESKLDEPVPLDWPNSAVVIDGEYDRQKTWREYALIREVDGNFYIRFNKKGDEPGFVDHDELRRWHAEFNGFTMEQEL